MSESTALTCMFLYDGKNGGKRGAVCGRAEAQHCAYTYRQCIESREVCDGVHHAFQRSGCCPTCKQPIQRKGEGTNG